MSDYERDALVGFALVEAARHRKDRERGGCTCGFCAWSVEHVLIMSVREAWDRPAVTCSRDLGRDAESGVVNDEVDRIERPWRVGRKVGRTIYNRLDVLVGVMDTPALAADAVEAVNALPAREKP